MVQIVELKIRESGSRRKKFISEREGKDFKKRSKHSNHSLVVVLLQVSILYRRLDQPTRQKYTMHMAITDLDYYIYMIDLIRFLS